MRAVRLIGCLTESFSVVEEQLVSYIVGIKVEVRIILLDSSECLFDHVLETLIHFALVNVSCTILEVLLEEPVRSLAVPYECMTSQTDTVLLAEFKCTCSSAEADLNAS